MIHKKARDYLAMILISILFYVPLFVRSTNFPFLGNDSYYYLNYIFQNTALHISTSSFVTEFVFGLFPANIFLIKIIMLIFTITSLIIFYETVEYIKKNRGLVASLFMLSAFWFAWIFIKFENDLFAFPFVLISLYFIVRYTYKSTPKQEWLDKDIILSLFFLFIAVIIWQYAVLFLIAYLILTKGHKMYWFAFALLIPFLPKLIRFIFTFSFKISENAPIKGLLILCFFAFLYLKEIRLKDTFLVVIVFTCLTAINYKVIHILIPILFLSFANIDINSNQKIKYTIIFLLILFLSIGVYQNFITYPTHKEYDLITIGVLTAEQQDKEYYVNWSIGYFGIYHNLDVMHYGTVPKEEIDYKNKIIITTNADKKIKECEILKKTKWISLANC
jgi:hypothetical protein